MLEHSGRLILLEVKPGLGMVQEASLAKALAALQHVARDRMGYLMLDDRGLGLSHFVDAADPALPGLARQTRAALDRHGPLDFRRVKALFEDSGLPLSASNLIGLCVRLDCSLSEGPFTLRELPSPLSFRPLLARPSALTRREEAGR